MVETRGRGRCSYHERGSGIGSSSRQSKRTSRRSRGARSEKRARADAQAASSSAGDGVAELMGMLNDIFELVLEIVESYGGDVVQFSGDALTILWRCAESDDDKGLAGGEAQAVILASACAALIFTSSLAIASSAFACPSEALAASA